MKRLIFITSYFLVIAIPAHATCLKCNIESIKVIEKNIENPSYEMVYDFLCSFDSSCSNNVEFTEWSNEVLFKVILKNPAYFLKALADKTIDISIILEAIKNPLLDATDFRSLYYTIKETIGDQNIKRRVLSAIETARRKTDSGLKR